MAKARFGNVSFSMFVDRAEVLRKVGENEVRLMNRVGGFGRTTVKRSMRPGGKSGKASLPGEPPRYQTKKLRDAVFFGYDSRTRSVVIGPVKAASKSKDVPVLLEQGGPVQNALIKVEDKRPEARRKKKSERVRVIRRSFDMQPRPYIGPQSVNYPKIIDKWESELKDSLTK